MNGIRMNFDKTTPGTVRYKSEDPDADIATLYVKKSAWPKNEHPLTIQVHVEIVTSGEVRNARHI